MRNLCQESLRRASLLPTVVSVVTFGLIACGEMTSTPTAPSAVPAVTGAGHTVSPLSTAQLHVELLGSGKGSVTSDVTGIACPRDCGHNYPLTTVVTLTATAGKNSRFAGWTDDCSGTSPTATILMDKDRRCAASFNRLADDNGAPGPDLADLIVSGIAGSAHQNVFSGTVWVKNVGTRQAVASATRIFFSRDRKLDGGDEQIGTDVPMSALAPGAEDREIFQFNLPAGTTGSYYIIALADATLVVEEVSETNNSRASHRQ